MKHIDFLGRITAGLVVMGFLFGGIFGVLDYFIVKFSLIGMFLLLAFYMFLQLYKNENHPDA